MADDGPTKAPLMTTSLLKRLLHGFLIMPLVYMTWPLPFSVPATATSMARSTVHIVERHADHDASPTQAELVQGDPSYSLLMHQSSGYSLLLIGLLTWVERSTVRRYPALRISIGSLWMMIGLFLFVRADPEGWPMGGEGFLASWTMPTAGEWLQHKVLSLIPLLIGTYTILCGGAARTNPNWNYGLGAVALLGAIGLLSHQHRDHPSMDIVNVQHHWFAATALLTAVSLILETWQRWGWERKNLLYPTCLIVLALQLLFYVE
jgi:hypothetical protein